VTVYEALGDSVRAGQVRAEAARDSLARAPAG
jgi:hypothetical protein